MNYNNAPFKVKAVYSWGGHDKRRDLGFIEGDIIEVIRVNSDQGTYYGESMRTKLFGNFPAKYAKILHVQENASSGLRGERYSRMNASTPMLPSLRKKSPKIPQSTSEYSLNKLRCEGLPASQSNSSPTSPRGTDLFSLNHQSYSFSDFEDQKIKSHSVKPDDDEFLKQLPPIPPKHRFQPDGFPSSKDLEYGQQQQQQQQQQQPEMFTGSTDTHNSSAFGYSDLSATSAGSYMRHTARNSQLQRQRQGMLEEQRPDHSSFFKRLLGHSRNLKPTLDEEIFRSSVADKNVEPTNDMGPPEILPPPQERRAENELERVKSLTGSERARRKTRALKEEPELILQPHKFISGVNKNEVVPDTKRNYALDSTPLAHVDRYIDQMPPDRFLTLEDLVNKRIANRFKTKVEKIRAVYTFLATRFRLVEVEGEKLSTKIMPGASNIKDMLYTRKCTPHQLTWLFFLMASALDLETEIVLGYFKKPFEYDDENNTQLLTLNHSWVSVLIDGEYRLVDVALGNPTNSILLNDLSVSSSASLEEYFDFYFLAKPLNLIYTHVPLHVDSQHIVPPLDPMAQLALPPLYPSFLKSGLKLYKFNQAIFRLEDFEVIDFDVEIPIDFEIKAMVQPLDEVNYTPERAYVQTYWKAGKRLAKVKATLPPNCSIGFLACYGRTVTGSDENSSMYSPQSFREEYNDFSLLVSVPCFHKGKFTEVGWCYLNPLPLTSSTEDIYIKEPQIYRLTLGNSYRFVIQAYPNDEEKGLNNFRSMLIAPSGSFSELQRIEGESWEVRKTLRETGEWRLVVPNESNGKWHVHAKWLCE